MTKIGYNINLSAIDNQTIEDADNSNAAMHLLMTTSHDAPRQVGIWKDRLGADKIVWRKYSTLEGNWSIYPDNDEIVKQWLSEGHLDIVRDDPCNEPSLANGDVEINKRYVKRSVDLLRKAVAMGIKVAIGAFSVGTPHHDRVADGTYDDLIRAVVEGGHYFSVHEYCPGIPGAGDTFGYYDLLEPQAAVEAMLPFKWPLGDYWLLRRSDRFVKRARAIGLADPSIIVTEAFIDLIPDANDVLNQLREQYGAPQYNKDLRGVLSWLWYYQDAFPNMTYPKVIEHLTKYVAEKVYNQPYHKAVCLFALNNLWDTPQGHNYLNSALDNFRRFALPAINDGIMLSPEPIENPSHYVMLPPDNPLWMVGEFTFAGLNFRKQPSLDGDIINKLGGGPHHGMLNEGQTIEVDGYNWVAIYIESLNYFGWVAKYKLSKPDVDYFTFVEDEIEVPDPEPEKQYIIDLLGMSMIVTETEYQKLLTFHRNIVTGLENAQIIEIIADS